MDYPSASKRKHSSCDKYKHLMENKEILPLTKEGKKFYFYNSEAIQSMINDLNILLKEIDIKNKTLKFLYFNEIQTSLAIEGYQFSINKISSDIKTKQGIVFSMKQAYEVGITNPKLSINNMISVFNIMQSYKDTDTETGLRTKDVFITDGINFKAMEKPRLIKERLKELFDFMNTSKLNHFIVAFSSHYIYESIHPFYDFNGRTGRLLMNMLFANKTNKTLPLLSQSIYAFQKKYYKSFDNSEDYDLTGFIINLLTGLYKFFLSYEQAIKFNLSPSLEALLVKIYLMDKKTFSIYQLKQNLNIYEKRASLHDKLKQLIKNNILKVSKEKTSRYTLIS